METERDITTIATQLLYRESKCLDQRNWSGWLDLYCEDAIYWVPAWRDEEEPTNDPDRELSQIYHNSRQGLEERVMRVESGKSVTAMPLPRTTHFITNVVGSVERQGVINVEANWMVQYFQPHRGERLVNFGDYELTLVLHDQVWLISRKRILLKNDLIPALLDFYML